MPKGGFVNKGSCAYVYDPEYQTVEQINDELWSENIDYVLALRTIARHSAGTQARTAANVLARHGKEEDSE